MFSILNKITPMFIITYNPQSLIFSLTNLSNIIEEFFQLFIHNSFQFGIFLIFGSSLFAIGAFGIAFNRKNLILILVSIEIMFLGINLVFIAGFIFLNLEVGLIYALINLSLAAAEAAIGFGLLIATFRHSSSITFLAVNKMKG